VFIMSIENFSFPVLQCLDLREMLSGMGHRSKRVKYARRRILENVVFLTGNDFNNNLSGQIDRKTERRSVFSLAFCHARI